MPQSSDEMRAKWGGECGVGDDKATKYLEGKGYTLSTNWVWVKPTPEHEPTLEECEAVQFLFEEWDYAPWIASTMEDALESSVTHVDVECSPRDDDLILIDDPEPPEGEPDCDCC